MMEISNEEFEKLVSEGIDSLPERFTNKLDEVSIITADEPTREQRVKLALRCNQSLFGLYEGVPLTKRGGNFSGMLPSVITIFKNPILLFSDNFYSLKKQIKHTLWHEIAHHYGLDHDRIHSLEQKSKI